MNMIRGSIIPPSIDLFHDRALQERSANTHHDHDRAASRQTKAHHSIERPISIRTDPSIQLYRGSLHGISDQRGLNKPKLLPFEKEQVFQQLWMRLWACKSFAKYRHDQRKGQRRVKDQIWSDRNEFLFFRALVEFWPTGRVQQIDERFQPKKNSGKAEFGRNELIALWMGQHIGHEVRRKEISSHLQVTKAKIKSEPAPDAYVLYWLGGLDSKHDEQKSFNALSRLVPSRVQREQHILEPVQFSIRIRETDAFGQVDNTAHTIAYSTSAAKREDQYLAAMPVWRRDYPDLSKILDDAHLWGVEIMLVDCPLNIINGTELRDVRSKASRSNCDVDLSIQNKFRIRSHVPPGEEWSCNTTFFQRGEVIGQSKNPHPAPIKTDALHTHWDGEYQTLMVPFKSDYWLSMICGFAERCESHDGEDVEQDIEDMLAVQEIRMRPRSDKKDDADSDGDGSEAPMWTTLLVLLWKFHVDSSPQPAETTWRSVFLPLEPLQGAKSDLPKPTDADDLQSSNTTGLYEYPEQEAAFELQPRHLPHFDPHDAVFDLDLASVPLAAQHYQHVNGRSSLLPSSMQSGGNYDYGVTFDSPLGLDFSGAVTSNSEHITQHSSHGYDSSMFGADFTGLTSPTMVHYHRQGQPDAASASTQMSTQPSQDSIFSHLTRTNTSSHSAMFSGCESDPGQFSFTVPFTTYSSYTGDAGTSPAFAQPVSWIQQSLVAPASSKVARSTAAFDPSNSSFSFLDYASPTSSHSASTGDDQAPSNQLVQHLAQTHRVLPSNTTSMSSADQNRHLLYSLPSSQQVLSYDASSTSHERGSVVIDSMPLPSAVLPSQPASSFPLLPPAAEEEERPAARQQRPRRLQPRERARAQPTGSNDAVVSSGGDSGDECGIKGRHSAQPQGYASDHARGKDNDHDHDDDDDDNDNHGRPAKRRRLLSP